MKTLARHLMRVALLGLVLLHASAPRADVLDEAWQRGSRALFAGDYPAALAAYGQLDAQKVVAADLYYNMGVAYFRLGDLGRAIWSFERALVVAPDDEDARFNLAQARKMAEDAAHDKLEGAGAEPAWIRAVTSVSPTTQVTLFLVFYLGCFGLLFARGRARPPIRVAVTTGAAILATFALLSGSLVAGRWYLRKIPTAIVLPASVDVKEGADASFRTSFKAHAGLRVRVLGQEQDFARIRLANGLEGFVRENAVGRL
jgi:tetratricopeptide (TPR) repeat protein